MQQLVIHRRTFYVPLYSLKLVNSSGVHGCVSYKKFKYVSRFQVVKSTTGSCSETMSRKFWDVQAFVGRTASVKLVDFSSGGWGHINFDDLRGDISCGQI